jgi:G3E family GTPase
MARHGVAGLFWAALPKAQWPEDPVYLQSIKDSWIEPFGDMRQELVFIGQGLEQQDIIQRLDACLLTDEDLLKGEKFWATLPDPFPSWGV